MAALGLAQSVEMPVAWALATAAKQAARWVQEAAAAMELEKAVQQEKAVRLEKAAASGARQKG